jgi:hypothetical protein
MPDKTWVAGDVVTAADTNTYLTHTGGAWNSYTPVVVQGATPTLAVNSARWHRTGRLITCQVVLTITSAGTAANNVTISLPVTAFSTSVFSVYGYGTITDASATTSYGGPVRFSTTTTLSIMNGAYPIDGILGSSGFTAALANNDIIAFTAQYEAAS